ADQSHHQANSEGAAAETESVNLIAHVEIAAYERVDVADVLPDADAQRAAERSEWLEVLGADTVVVENELLRIFRVSRRLDVDRLIKSPDVGFEWAGGAVASPVGQQDDV